MTNRSSVRYLAIIGPTASGKSALALGLAQKLGGELVNCDSVQMYRGFDIGAAKPNAAEQGSVAHHLWDILDWSEGFDARLYAELAETTICSLVDRCTLPILVGGTGLYLRALWKEKWHDLPKSDSLRAELALISTEDLRQRLQTLDPERAAVLHPNDRFRLQRALEVVTLLGHPVGKLQETESERGQCRVIRVRCDRQILHQRIAQRVEQMLAQGLIEEVEALLRSGVDPLSKPMQSIGYSQVVDFLRGKITRGDLGEFITIATRQYAKRQETWFRQVQEDYIWESGESIDRIAKSLRLELGDHEA